MVFYFVFVSSAANAVPDKEVNDETKAKRSLTPETDHFKKASKTLRNMEELDAKPGKSKLRKAKSLHLFAAQRCCVAC